jgi:hypothetical protein
MPGQVIKSTYSDYKIVLYEKDETIDNTSLCILLGWYGSLENGKWCNTRIVSRKTTPKEAFLDVLNRAEDLGIQF